jgi:hypothetical protein
MRLMARPAAANAARAPSRTVNGAVPGTNRRIDASTALTTRSAASTDIAPAIPWCIAARGMSDGPNDANIARVFRGADGLFVIGLNRSAAHTAAFVAASPAFMNRSSSS